ncbi:MAG: LTA synthase family protein [Flavobacteriales bacterium]|nr:LTA synthase family protein [Flavobacteriales bacterium]
MRVGPLSVLLLRLGLVAALYTLLRLLFVWHNAALFPDVPLTAYLGGMRFDLFAIAWLYLPWLLLVLFSPRPGTGMERIQLAFFLVASALGLLLNTVDVGYYAFTLKRSTSDLFNIIGAGGDMLNLVPAFLRDYWYLLLAFAVAMVLVAWGYRRIGRLDKGDTIKLPWRIGWRVLAIALVVLASRGGTQLIPLQPLDGARYGGAANLPVVLNTPYTMLMSIGKPSLEERIYMPREEADRLWPVVHQPNREHQPFEYTASTRKPNVVVIILESFSAAYSGTLSGGEGYMPFLDSLMGHSLNFTRAYANGRRSIDGVPAILASMPELMDEAFLTSRYASIPFTSLASVFAADGYHTSFYHGGRNGTMGFDGFTRSAGFQRYVGMDEYPNGKEDYDGNWGIRDRPFLQFWAQELAKEQEPFLSTVFTLSSHHPYRLPKEEAERFAGGTQAIHPTLRYTDDALRQFFATARTMPWYANTLFVITADHTADLERTGAHGDLPIDYWVPLLYYAPGVAVSEHPNPLVGEARDAVTQHIDILPTVLDLTGQQRPVFSFGSSALRNTHQGVAIWSANGIYSITNAHMQLQFDGERVVDQRMIDDTLSEEARTAMATNLEQRLKAAIQQFNHHLMRGALVAQPASE